VEEVDKKSVEEIRDLVTQKSSKIKSEDGGDDYKAETSSLKYLHASIIGFLTPFRFFVLNKLGIELKAMRGKKHNFGAFLVSSVGSFNVEDASAPLFGTAV
jgi:hypothetical protein